MKKIRLELASLSVASFQIEGGPGDGDGMASTTATDTNGRSCYEYCGPDDQHTGPTVITAGC